MELTSEKSCCSAGNNQVDEQAGITQHRLQVSQKAGKVVWYSRLFQNFPQYIVNHTVKSFSIVNEAEVDAFFGIPLVFCDPMDKSSLKIWKFSVHVLLNPSLENFEHCFASV